MWKIAVSLFAWAVFVNFYVFHRLEAQSAPVAQINPAFKDRPPYRIGPGDVVQITVWNEPQVSQPSVMVLPDGKINMPFVGEVGVAGFTLKEVESRLNTLFKPFITDPDVRLSGISCAGRRVMKASARTCASIQCKRCDSRGGSH